MVQLAIFRLQFLKKVCEVVEKMASTDRLAQQKLISTIERAPKLPKDGASPVNEIKLLSIGAALYMLDIYCLQNTLSIPE